MNNTIRGLLFIAAIIVIMTPLCWLFLKVMTLSGLVETEEQTTKRRQDEADALAEMPPDVRQLHIEAERSKATAKFSFFIWVLTTIVSVSLVYWLLK